MTDESGDCVYDSFRIKYMLGKKVRLSAGETCPMICRIKGTVWQG